MGFGTILVLTPAAIVEQSGPLFGMNVLNADVPAWTGCCIEFVATSILVWFCCAVWDPRNAHTQDSVPIRFGLALTGLSLVAVDRKSRMRFMHSIFDLYPYCLYILFVCFFGCSYERSRHIRAVASIRLDRWPRPFGTRTFRHIG